MKSRVTMNDLVIVAGSSAALLAVGLLVVRLPTSWTVFIVACVAVILLLQLETMRRTSEQLNQVRKEAFDDYRQVESLLSLHSVLEPDKPVPHLRDFSASPDILNHAVSLMLKTRPQLTVELGSGSSTVFLAYCLRRIGSGKLISIDHDEAFANRTRQMLADHGLSEIASVVHRPLETVRIGDTDYKWYSRVEVEGAIDFLFIDGPPFHVHPLARYPALPLLLPKMADRGVALLDDADRPEELDIARMWEKEFPQLKMTRIATEKGSLLIARSTSSYSLAGKFG